MTNYVDIEPSETVADPNINSGSESKYKSYFGDFVAWICAIILCSTIVILCSIVIGGAISLCIADITQIEAIKYLEDIEMDHYINIRCNPDIDCECYLSSVHYYPNNTDCYLNCEIICSDGSMHYSMIDSKNSCDTFNTSNTYIIYKACDDDDFMLEPEYLYTTNIHDQFIFVYVIAIINLVLLILLLCSCVVYGAYILFECDRR